MRQKEIKFDGMVHIRALIIDVYCSLHYYHCDEQGFEDMVDLPQGDYTFLEPTQIDNYGDLNRGLARFIYDENLASIVKQIKYACFKNKLHFKITFVDDTHKLTDIISYEGKRKTILAAVCSFIKGQLEDGWGESGFHIFHNDTEKLYHCQWKRSEGLLKLDRRATDDYIMAHEELSFFADFDKYAIFTKI